MDALRRGYGGGGSQGDQSSRFMTGANVERISNVNPILQQKGGAVAPDASKVDTNYRVPESLAERMKRIANMDGGDIQVTKRAPVPAQPPRAIAPRADSPPASKSRSRSPVVAPRKRSRTPPPRKKSRSRSRSRTPIRRKKSLSRSRSRSRGRKRKSRSRSRDRRRKSRSRSRDRKKRSRSRNKNRRKRSSSRSRSRSPKKRNKSSVSPDKKEDNKEKDKEEKPSGDSATEEAKEDGGATEKNGVDAETKDKETVAAADGVDPKLHDEIDRLEKAADEQDKEEAAKLTAEKEDGDDVEKKEEEENGELAEDAEDGAKKKEDGSRSPKKKKKKKRSRSRDRKRKRRSRSRSRKRSRSPKKKKKHRSRSKDRKTRKRGSKSRSRSRTHSRSGSRDRGNAKKRNDSAVGPQKFRGSRSPSPTPRYDTDAAGPCRAVQPKIPPSLAVKAVEEPKEQLTAAEVEERMAKQQILVAAKKAEQAKLLNIPTYLNPSMINIKEYKQTEEKKKKLWSGGVAQEKDATQWAGALETEQSNEKFQRLMGIHSNLEGANKTENLQRGKQVLNKLEQQFDQSMAFQMNRAMGIGYGAPPPPPPPPQQPSAVMAPLMGPRPAVLPYGVPPPPPMDPSMPPPMFYPPH